MAKRVASRTQIPSHAAKRPRRALEAPPGLPCASGQIQSRGVKRSNHVLSACSVTAQTSCSWGAKRARTGTARSGTPGFWCRSVERCLPCHSCCVNLGGNKGRIPQKALDGPDRDRSVNSPADFRRSSVSAFGSDAFSSWGRRRAWADLGDDPAGLIAELVLANDVADYIRFRAVCRPWRRCSADPSSGSSLDGRFLPRKWVMLDKAHAGPGPGPCPCRRRFLNISTGECIRTDLPELASGHTLLALTPEGLLLVVHEHTLVARLLNPLTRQLIELPLVTALLAREQQRAWRSGCASAGDIIWVHGVGVGDASAVAVCFSSPRVVAVARPGDGCWTVVDANRYVDSALACAGRFYCASGNSVMVLDTDGQPPRLRPVAAESFCFSRMSATLHLIDNAGELKLVHRMLLRDRDTAAARASYKRKYEVWKVDLDAGALVPAKDLGGRSVLLSLGRTISVPAGAFPSVTADTLYFGFDCDEKTTLNQIDAYNVADGSSLPWHHRSSVGIVQPWSAVDCLAYCIQGNGEHLA